MSSKLDKPIEHWLKEINFPKLYKKTSGNELTETEIHFLLYRISRMKDISIDAETLELIKAIDKTCSNDFAETLLQFFFDNGAEAKHKWCMTLASVLGNDKIIDTLKTKANSWLDNARPKMAEYAVQAIVLNASTKAFRIVDYFSRKYKSKSIGKTATLTFKSVAEFMGVSENDLSDAIIPDFGFESLFKVFEIKGDEYRAFIDNDFKIAFLNEDNLLLNALPKGASLELKNEFKNIAKEIKETVRAQTPRLESCLVTQRFWTSEKWKALFLNNPVMFVYAVHLIWGIYDEHNILQKTFAVQEDQTLINKDGNEINLESDKKIGIVHPLLLETETVSYWKNYLFDLELPTVFPQLERKIFKTTNADKKIKISNNYRGVKLNAFTFIGTLDKKGWSRGSVGDGGNILSYYKTFTYENITAIIEQIGVVNIGYYEEPAILGGLMFVTGNKIRFGSYFYDEPGDENDTRLINFGDVPPIIYSEVIADMETLK